MRGDRGYCAIDGQSMVILPSFGSAAVALHKCLCLDLALPLFYSPASLRLGLSPAWSYSSDNFPAALSDPGSEPGTNTPLENAPDNLQGYLTANPFFNSGVSRHDF